MSPSSEPEPHAAPRREFLVELLGLHARALLRMPRVQVFLVLGLGLVMLSHVPAWMFLAWGAATTGTEVLRARYAARLLQRGLDVDPQRAHSDFVALAALSGAVIGAGAVLFLPRLPILQQATLGAALVAIPSAGVAVAQSSRYVLGAYAIAILIPASLTWGILHPGQLIGVMSLTTLLCVVLVLVAADGDKLLLRSVVIRHERDRLVRDLEQRNADVRSAMELAEQSAQSRARVLAAASHDLRQPLHALSVYSAVLAAHPAPATLNEVSQNIDQIVRTLGNLLNGLLDLSRLSAGFYVPERQAVQLDRSVADVCVEYERAASQKNLAIRRQLEPIRLLGDPIAIGRIVRNLLDNAIKYTDSGEIRVTTHSEPRGDGLAAVVSVADTGRGIPAAEQRRIFEEFYQLDNPGRDRSKGVGLGLAIVQRLCELIGAVVSVESTPGQGTCFRVALPVVAPADSVHPGATAAVSGSSFGGKRVYVVDDERDILTSMRTLLNVWGIDVATAESPSAASQLFAEGGAPDLLIADLRFGDQEHGADLALRLQRAYGGFPVLIVTGETSSDALRKANEQNYTLLQKPIMPEVLKAAIDAALSGEAGAVMTIPSGCSGVGTE